MFSPKCVRALPWMSFVGFVGLAVSVPSISQAAPKNDAPATLANSETVFEGMFETRIADYPDGTSRTFHVLTQPGVGMEIDVDPADHPELVRGATIRVTGARIDEMHFKVDSIEQIAPPPELLIDPEKRDPRRIAFLMVNWGNPGGVAKEAAKVEMYTGKDSTNVFYQEVSYGMEKIAGNVFGSFTVPEPTGCNMDALSNNARNAMEQAGYDTGEFKQFMYYFAGYNACGWAGLASVGAPLAPARDSWYNGAFGCVVRAQEIGHNYGMGHSKSLSGCLDANDNLLSYSQNCDDAYNNSNASEFAEYGDPYDPMGGGCAHINSVQKAYMGWIEDCNIVTADADGTFNLMAVELPCNGAQALRFPIDDKFYYLEYRQPLGTFDAKQGLSGVLVRVARGYNGSPSPHILDMNLDGPGRFMSAGDSYTDYLDRVSFTVLEEHDTHAVIQVTFPNGGSGSDPVCDGGATPATEGGNWGTLECAAEPFPVDDTPPTVSITYPADGEVFPAGASFELTAEAMDDNGITELELYLDGEPTFKDFEEPWSWSLSNVPEGTYQFGIVARDGPNWAPSEPVTIIVGDPPSGGTDSGGTDSGTGGGTTTTTTTDGTTGEDTDTDGDTDSDTAGTDTKGDGCACTTSSPQGGALAFMGLVVGAAARRRRRR